MKKISGRAPSDNPAHPLRTAWRSVKLYPRETSWAIALLLLAGIAEGIGVMSLLPLLAIAGGERQEDGGLAGFLLELLARLGLDSTIYPLAVLIVVAISVKAILLMLSMRKAGYVGAAVATKLRLELTDSLMNARWTYFIKQPAGALTNSLGTEAFRVSMMVTQSCYFLAGVIQASLYLILALFVSWYVTVGGILAGLLLFGALGSLIRRAKRSGVEQTELYRSQSIRLADSLTALKALRAMGRLEGIKKVLRDGSSNLDSAYRGQVFSQALLTAIQEPFLAFFLAFGMAVTLGIAEVPLVQVLFMAVVFQRIVTRLSAAQVAYQMISISESAFRSLKNEIEKARTVREVSEGRRTPTLTQGIDLVDVSFAYDESEPILSTLQMSIPASCFTALLGPSGAGKTTIVDLLIGLLSPQSGDIYVDDVSLRDIDLNEWRAAIGYVPQDTVLLNASIADNVLLDHEGLDLVDVERALRQAEAWGFVSSLPDGIHTSVGERGTRLSGGQRQRVGIARALVHRPRLLILDEATTGLDPVTEDSILRTLQKLASSTTLVAISHQQSLMGAADVVYRLQGGKAELIKDQNGAPSFHRDRRLRSKGGDVSR